MEMLGLTAVALRHELCPAMLDLYLADLEDLPLEAVIAALGRLRRTSKFFPRVCEIREAVAPCTVDDLARRALVRVEWAISSVGAYRSIRFDPVTNAAIRALGGWPHCCHTPASEFDRFWRARFLKTWAAAARCGVGEGEGAVLTGLSDAGDQTVIGIDGTHRTVHLPGPVECTTGVEAALAALPVAFPGLPSPPRPARIEVSK